MFRSKRTNLWSYFCNIFENGSPDPGTSFRDVWCIHHSSFLGLLKYFQRDFLLYSTCPCADLKSSMDPERVPVRAQSEVSPRVYDLGEGNSRTIQPDPFRMAARFDTSNLSPSAPNAPPSPSSERSEVSDTFCLRCINNHFVHGSPSNHLYLFAGVQNQIIGKPEWIMMILGFRIRCQYMGLIG